MCGASSLQHAQSCLMSSCNADWTSRLFGPGHGSYTIDDGITASNAVTLEQKWRRPAPACPGGRSGGGWLATPVTFDGVIYIGSNFGCLFAINEANGTVRWSRFAAFQPRQTCVQRLGIVSSVVVRNEGAGPVLYFHSPDGWLYKLDASDGSTIWRSLVQVPSPDVNDVYAWSSPTVADGKVIIGVSSNCDIPFVQGQVRVYDQQTGNLMWVHKLVPDGFVGAGDWYDAAVDGNGDVYVSTGSTTNEQAVAHPNTSPGFEQYSIVKLDGRNGRSLVEGPRTDAHGRPRLRIEPHPLHGQRRRHGGRDQQGRMVSCVPSGHRSTGVASTGGDSRARRDQGRALRRGLGRHSAVHREQRGRGPGEPGPNHPPVSGGRSAASPAARFGASVQPGDRRIALRGRRRAFELAMPSNILGPCSMNAHRLLVCAGGKHVGNDLSAHDNGLFIIDTTRRARILHHLEDVRNFAGFSQPVLENGAILAANTDALSKWAPLMDVEHRHESATKPRERHGTAARTGSGPPSRAGWRMFRA